MLPEMFCRAKDCACRPVTAVVIASKIPIGASIALTAAGGVGPDAPAAWPQQPSQTSCHGKKCEISIACADAERRLLGRMRRSRQFLPMLAAGALAPYGRRARQISQQRFVCVSKAPAATSPRKI